jgi:hypothetical protein
VVGVGLEHGPRTLTLPSDHATHLLRRRRRREGRRGNGRCAARVGRARRPNLI